MRRFWLFALAWLALSALVPALAQVGLPWPGPGTVHSTGGGGSSFAPVGSPVMNSAFAGTTVAVSISVTGGNFVLGVINIDSARTITGVAMDTGPACSLASNHATTAGHLTYAYACPNVTNGSRTVTATASGTISQADVEAEQWSGSTCTTAACLIDKNISNTSNATSATINCGSASMTPTNNNELIWCGAYQQQGDTMTVGTASGVPGNLTFNANNLTSSGIYTEYGTQTTLGATNPTINSGASSFDNLMVALAIKAS